MRRRRRRRPSGRGFGYAAGRDGGGDPIARDDDDDVDESERAVFESETTKARLDDAGLSLSLSLDEGTRLDLRTTPPPSF